MLHEILENVGLEMIDFQVPELFTGITTLAGRLRKAIDDKNIKGEFEVLKDINFLVWKRTGLRIDTVVDENSDNAAICVLPKAHQHPFYSKQTVRSIQDIDLNTLVKKMPFKGQIDLKASKVKGDFAEDTPSTVYISPGLFTDLSDEEVSAVILHELGHLFFYYAFLAVGAVTNAVVAEVAQHYQGTPTREQTITLLKRIESATSTRFDNLDEMVKAQPGTVVAVVNANVIDNVRRELGTKFYDARLNEAMADRFVVRHGGAKHLATGLRKVYGNDSSLKSALTLGFAAINFTWTAAGMGPLMTLLVPGLAGAPMAAAAIGVGMVVMLSWGATALLGFDDTYDDYNSRIQAIRRELIGKLKDAKMPEAAKKAVLEDLDAIQATSSKMASLTPSSVTSAAGGFLASYFSGRHAEFKLNRQLETLANNELFVAAAKLSVH